eukprot:scaffold129976_cov36-Phaeocystis_antarctica.AAC.1
MGVAVIGDAQPLLRALGRPADATFLGPVFCSVKSFCVASSTSGGCLASNLATTMPLLICTSKCSSRLGNTSRTSAIEDAAWSAGISSTADAVSTSKQAVSNRLLRCCQNSAGVRATETFHSSCSRSSSASPSTKITTLGFRLALPYLKIMTCVASSRSSRIRSVMGGAVGSREYQRASTCRGGAAMEVARAANGTAVGKDDADHDVRVFIVVRERLGGDRPILADDMQRLDRLAQPRVLATATLRIECRIDDSFDDSQLAVAGQHCKELAESLLSGLQVGECAHELGDRHAGIHLDGTAVVRDCNLLEVREVQHRSSLLSG